MSHKFQSGQTPCHQQLLLSIRLTMTTTTTQFVTLLHLFPYPCTKSEPCPQKGLQLLFVAKTTYYLPIPTQKFQFSAENKKHFILNRF